MKWLKIWKIGKAVAAVLEAQGVSVKGVPISTITDAIETGAAKIKDARPDSTGNTAAAGR